MKNMKGIGLLLIANILIFLTLSVTFTLLSEVILPAFGIDLGGSFVHQDLLWAFVIGFGGAFIGLAFSKQMARMMLDCRRITRPQTHAEAVVHETVVKIAGRLGITAPEVWVYDSPDPNAFATGPSKNNSMVAVSTGLLQHLNEGEVRAVLAHEMGHVHNGDMFTTTVLAGLMNTFVYFISRMVYRTLAERNHMLAIGAYFFLQIVLSILAMIPISWWSRRREFFADRFAADTVGKEHMISALQSIHQWVTRSQYHYRTEDALATMKISGRSRSFMQVFSTHPPIEARVAALRKL